MAGETDNAEVEAVASATLTGGAPGPAQSAARFHLVDWLSFIAATVLALAGYSFTLAPDVTLGYSGITSTGAYYAGVPHPPGYPVWTLYSWCFIELLPFSNVAWRVAMSSAVASALACGLVALMVARGGMLLFQDAHWLVSPTARELACLRFACGVVAGLVLAFSGNVWRFAVIAETQAVSLLLFVAVLCLYFRWSLAPDRKRYLSGAFLLFGLLLTNAQELILALPGLLVAIMLVAPKMGRDLTLFILPVAVVATSRNQWRLWGDHESQINMPLSVTVCATGIAALVLAVTSRGIGKEWKFALGCGLAFLLGIAVYLYVPLASMSTPPVNWGYPRTVEGFWHVIGREQYESANPAVDIYRFAGLLWEFLMRSGHQFGWLYLAVALLPFGLVSWLNPLCRRLLAGLAVIWFCVTILMLVGLNPPPDRQAREMTGQYFAPSHVISAVWFGLGLTIVGAKAAARKRARTCVPSST